MSEGAEGGQKEAGQKHSHLSFAAKSEMGNSLIWDQDQVLVDSELLELGTEDHSGGGVGMGRGCAQLSSALS